VNRGYAYPGSIYGSLRNRILSPLHSGQKFGYCGIVSGIFRMRDIMNSLVGDFQSGDNLLINIDRDRIESMISVSSTVSR
jgi:hypothetical protein